MGDDPWAPTRENLTAENWQSMRAWLSRGNSLVVVTTAPGELPSSLRRDLIPSNVTETGAGSASFVGGESIDSRPETSQAPVKGGGILTVRANGPRWSVPASLGPDSGAPAKKLAPPPPDADAARWQLAADQRGGVLFRIPVGQGAVYVLLDDFAWTNSGLDHGGNAGVLAEVLSRELRGGVVAFDEYRHGHGRAESFLTYLLYLPGSSALMSFGALWAFLFFYGRNVRLKPVEAYVERQRRTAQEYIDAVAQLYERARASPLVVDAVARRLRQFARSSAGHAPAVDAALQIAEDYVAAGERPASPTRAIQLVTELIQLRKQTYGTRTLS
jgi:hypothetical protein